VAIKYADISSVDGMLNEAEIAPDSVSLTENVNNILNNLIDYYPNLPPKPN
jgi:hypothetical protein